MLMAPCKEDRPSLAPIPNHSSFYFHSGFPKYVPPNSTLVLYVALSTLREIQAYGIQ